ncbi:hypothetical protein R3P38DRAFT_2803929 [Favolaschia claudopus]|uniref:Uncharacterized protein n=1 Tax=Favolaschia claudopus TaxID=2862362 RepID=A0AAV9ZR30_9AGAR
MPMRNAQSESELEKYTDSAIKRVAACTTDRYRNSASNHLRNPGLDMSGERAGHDGNGSSRGRERIAPPRSRKYQMAQRESRQCAPQKSLESLESPRPKFPIAEAEDPRGSGKSLSSGKEDREELTAPQKAREIGKNRVKSRKRRWPKHDQRDVVWASAHHHNGFYANYDGLQRVHRMGSLVRTGSGANGGGNVGEGLKVKQVVGLDSSWLEGRGVVIDGEAFQENPRKTGALVAIYKSGKKFVTKSWPQPYKKVSLH